MNQTVKPVKERRCASRRQPKKSAKITCFKGSMGLGSNLAVSLLDVSETGIRMITKSALDKGQEIVVELLGPGHARPVKYLAVVVWSLATADNTFCLGARFERRLDYGDLVKLT